MNSQIKSIILHYIEGKENLVEKNHLIKSLESLENYYNKKHTEEQSNENKKAKNETLLAYKELKEQKGVDEILIFHLLLETLFLEEEKTPNKKKLFHSYLKSYKVLSNQIYRDKLWFHRGWPSSNLINGYRLIFPLYYAGDILKNINNKYTDFLSEDNLSIIANYLGKKDAFKYTVYEEAMRIIILQKIYNIATKITPHIADLEGGIYTSRYFTFKKIHSFFKKYNSNDFDIQKNNRVTKPWEASSVYDLFSLLENKLFDGKIISLMAINMPQFEIIRNKIEFLFCLDTLLLSIEGNIHDRIYDTINIYNPSIDEREKKITTYIIEKQIISKIGQIRNLTHDPIFFKYELNTQLDQLDQLHAFLLYPFYSFSITSMPNLSELDCTLFSFNHQEIKKETTLFTLKKTNDLNDIPTYTIDSITKVYNLLYKLRETSSFNTLPIKKNHDISATQPNMDDWINVLDAFYSFKLLNNNKAELFISKDRNNTLFLTYKNNNVNIVLIDDLTQNGDFFKTLVHVKNSLRIRELHQYQQEEIEEEKHASLKIKDPHLTYLPYYPLFNKKNISMLENASLSENASTSNIYKKKIP